MININEMIVKFKRYSRRWVVSDTMGKENNQESNNGVGSVEGVDRGAIRN
jgi:hypothetical protein